ncbi:hypothetical protein [Streptomyces sp. ODS28]|uniref:hypothetical protein n=1 Tax=Streptomyces sp. ODS28 TaxID=3136688 RepID=UPI0031EEA829
MRAGHGGREEPADEQRQQVTGDKYAVGNISGGAVALGPGSSAVVNEAAGPGPDEDTRALLEAVRALRGELAVLARSAATEEAERELSAAEREIDGTGRAAPGRLRRLRELTAPGVTAVGALASAATVAQAAAQLLG